MAASQPLVWDRSDGPGCCNRPQVLSSLRHEAKWGSQPRCGLPPRKPQLHSCSCWRGRPDRGHALTYLPGSGTHLYSRAWLSLTAVSICSPHPVPTGSVSVVIASRTARPPLHVPGATQVPWPSPAGTLADTGSKPPGVPFPGWPVPLGGHCPHDCCLPQAGTAPWQWPWLPPVPRDQRQETSPRQLQGPPLQGLLQLWVSPQGLLPSFPATSTEEPRNVPKDSASRHQSNANPRAPPTRPSWGHSLPSRCSAQ